MTASASAASAAASVSACLTKPVILSLHLCNHCSQPGGAAPDLALMLCGLCQNACHAVHMVHGVRRKLSGGQAGTYLDSVCPRCVASIPQDPFAAATTAASASPAFSQPVRVSSQPFIDSSGASAPGAFYRHDHTGLVRDMQGLHLFVGAAPPPPSFRCSSRTPD